MSDSSPPLRFQGHHPGWALLTGSPLAACSAILLWLGVVIESSGWVVFSSVALACCLALILFRFRVVIDRGERSVRRAWCLGFVPLLRRDGGLDSYEYVTFSHYDAFQAQRGGPSAIWQIAAPRYRVGLVGEGVTVTLGAFYRRSPAHQLAERTAQAIDLPLFDRT